MFVANGFAVQNDLRCMIGTGFKQQRIHVCFTRNASSLSLYGLRTTYLEAVGGGIGVECHILRFEGGWRIAILTEDATEGSSQDAFAYIAACANKHQGV